MGGGFGPACRCIRAVCRWLFLNDRLWTLFSHLFGEVGLGVRAIARPHPINDPDHPRVSGENLPVNGSLEASKGSSLLARGKLDRTRTWAYRARIIPACAGKTVSISRVVVDTVDHPCLRGENKGWGKDPMATAGSSLLARGKQP